MFIYKFIGLFGVPKFRAFLIILCASLALSLAITSIFEKSVVYDEYAILPQGFVVLKTKAFNLGTGVPHMAAILPAIPLLLTSAKLDESKIFSTKNAFQIGHNFLLENAKNYQDYILIGRFVSIFALALTGLLAYGFSRSLYGAYGGMITAIFVFFSPNLIAHGRLVTTDIYLTAMMIGSLWAFDYFLRIPGWKSAILLGIGLGLASVFKFSGVILFAIFPLVLAFLFLKQRLWVVPQQNTFTLNWRVWIGSIGVVLITLIVINQSYLWEGSFSLIENFPFISEYFQGFQSLWPHWLPIPLPYFFLMGLDEQLSHTGWIAYLMGEMNRTGFWYYYVIVFLVKTPLPLLLLSLWVLLNKWKIEERETPMLATALLSFLFFSMMGHKNIGLRYLLFIIPIMGIWIGRWASFQKSVSPKQKFFTMVLISSGALWMLIISVVIWPNYLTYFNLVSGGPSRGHQYLLDSNLDWGQDLIALKKYMHDKKINSIDLAYFGTVDPALYDIRYHLIGEKKPQRYMAISANILWGGMRYYTQNLSEGLRQPWGLPHARDLPEQFFKEWIAPFQSLRPKAILGHTIYLFDMEEQSATERGLIYLKLQQYEQALELYSSIIKDIPDEAINYERLADAYFGLQQYQQAVIHYTKAIEHLDKNVTTYMGRAKTYLQLKQFQKAVQDFKIVLKLDPNEESQVKTYLNVYLEEKGIVPSSSN